MLKVKACGLPRLFYRTIGSFCKNGRGLFFLIFFFCFLRELFPDEPGTLELERIIVSKSKTHLLKTYSLESDLLKELPFANPIELLSILPLDLQSRSIKGGIQTDFSLRGSTFQGVVMLVDGLRINDPQTAHHNADIPLTNEDIERIEVIPGLGSSLFGPDAIGGAVNIITKKPKEKKRVLELKIGDYQSGSGLFSITERFNNLGLRFSIENQESNGFYTDTDFKKFTANLASNVEFGCIGHDFSFGYQEKEFGAYDFYTPSSGYQSKEWTKVYLLNTGLKIDKDDFIIKPSFLWRRHEDKFALDKTLKLTTYLNHHRSDVLTPGIYFQNESELLGKVGLGLEYGEERINSTNLGKYNRDHKSIFIDNSKDLINNLSWGLSLRADDFDGFKEFYTGSASLRYDTSMRDSFSLSISKSRRIPSFTELYYSDPKTLGNSGLSAEKALNYQVSYDYKKDDLSLGVTLFFREEEDLMDWVRRSVSQKWQIENITEAKVNGLESYLSLKINDYLSLDSNYTYIDKCIDDQGYLYKYGPNYIKHLVNSSFRVQLPFGVQVISFSLKKKPRRNEWFLLNPSFSYNINKKSQIFLKITNLFNVEYQEIEGIPSPGRWIEAGLRFDW